MKKLLPLLLIVLATLTPAAAQQAPVRQDPAAALNPDKTTVLDCLTILGGLNEIDGKRQVIVNAGKPNEQVIETVYEFRNGRLRQDISRNIRLLGDIQRDQQAASQREMMLVSKGRGEIRLSEKPSEEERTEYLRQTVEFDKRMKEQTAAPCPIDGLTRIKASELKLDQNEIRAGALAAIDKILDR